MIFRKVSSESEVVLALSDQIAKPLQKGMRVIWFVSGGSSLSVAAEVSKKLHAVTSNKKTLFVTLVDDKYGTPDGHTNWEQLLALGFKIGDREAHGILQPGLTLAKTAEHFEAMLRKRLDWADFAIGQFGIGDGQHTGGILAHSPAAREQRKFVVGYAHQGQGKVTITPALIEHLDVAFINSMGEGKRKLVQHFLQSTALIAAEPTQSLKAAKQTFLYSDVL